MYLCVWLGGGGKGCGNGSQAIIVTAGASTSTVQILSVYRDHPQFVPISVQMFLFGEYFRKIFINLNLNLKYIYHPTTIVVREEKVKKNVITCSTRSKTTCGKVI